MSTKPLLVPFATAALPWKTVAVAASSRSQPHRQFSRTPSRQAESIHFHKTTNPALEKILRDIQHYIILPSYLKQPQRKIIFDPEQKQRLLDDPITIELDGETVRYSHISMREVPAADTILKKAVDAFKHLDDWKNLEPLLVGLYQAGRVLHADTQSKIVRRAAQQGRLDDLFYIMRQAARTGFFMNAHEPISTFVSWTYRECMIEDRGRAHALKRGMNRCSILFGEILEREEHGGNPIAKSPHLKFRNLRFPLTRDPQLLSVPLGLAAQHTLLEDPHVIDQDKSLAEVKRLAVLICNLWRPRNPSLAGGLGGQGLAGLHPEDSYYDANWAKYLRNPNKRLEWEAILVRSFEDAAEVLAREGGQLLPVACQLARIAEVVRAEAEVDIGAPEMSTKRVGHYVWQHLVEDPISPLKYTAADQWRPDEESRKKLRMGEKLHPMDMEIETIRSNGIANQHPTTYAFSPNVNRQRNTTTV